MIILSKISVNKHQDVTGADEVFFSFISPFYPILRKDIRFIP